ncbi:MAG: hypothetical protein MZW92_45080 [Comamonadaceae bacterium]|nr:hypothetical protein [Comamonadaceae bacterium]
MPGYTTDAAGDGLLPAGRTCGADANAHLAAVRADAERPGLPGAARRAQLGQHAPPSGLCRRPGRGRRASTSRRNPSSDARQPGRVLQRLHHHRDQPRQPATTTQALPDRYSGVGNFTTRRDLTRRDRTRTRAAPPATGSPTAEAHRNGADYMVADAAVPHPRTMTSNASGSMRPVDAAPASDGRTGRPADRIRSTQPTAVVTDLSPTGPATAGARSTVAAGRRIRLHGRDSCNCTSSSSGTSGLRLPLPAA